MTLATFVSSAHPDQRKAGQGMTFWIVITAVIALVVLVILLMIFTGKTGMFERGLMDCEGKGGFCIPCSEETEDCSDICESNCGMEKYRDCSYSSVFSCVNVGDVCCLGIKSE